MQLCYGCGHEAIQVWFTYNGSPRCGTCLADARDAAGLRPIAPYQGRGAVAAVLLGVFDEHKAAHRDFRLGCPYCHRGM